MPCAGYHINRALYLNFLRKYTTRCSFRSFVVSTTTFHTAGLFGRGYSTTLLNNEKGLHSEDQNSGDSGPDAEMKSQILESSLAFVSKFGWSREAIEAGCQAKGLPPGLHAFAAPQGGIDIVLHFYATRNQQLAEAMLQWKVDEQTLNDNNSPSEVQRVQTTADMDNFLYRALEYRLKAIVPVIDVWPQAVGILALPTNIPSSLGLLAQLVDEIWAQAGDRSVDMTWYAKRLGLAYVYNLTEVYMLQDKSPDLVDSWTFLRGRINDLRSLKQMNPNAVASLLKNGVSTFGNITFNVLGFNRRR